MSFRDIIASDIENVFFGNEEFEETAEINGKQIPVITDEDILKERAFAVGGVFEASRTIYVSEQYMKRPKQGSVLILNKQTFTVLSATSSMGVLEIVITRKLGR